MKIIFVTFVLVALTFAEDSDMNNTTSYEEFKQKFQKALVEMIQLELERRTQGSASARGDVRKHLQAKDTSIRPNGTITRLFSELDALKAKVSTLTEKISDLPSSGDVRLVNKDGSKVVSSIGGPAYGSSGGRLEGRLEVYYWGEWGTVCDDRVMSGGASIQGNNNMATVVCRMLRSGSSGTVHNKAGMGQGTGKIWLDNVDCTGNELRLADCSRNNFGSHNCNHGEDVGITCS